MVHFVMPVIYLLICKEVSKNKSLKKTDVLRFVLIFDIKPTCIHAIKM